MPIYIKQVCHFVIPIARRQIKQGRRRGIRHLTGQFSGKLQPNIILGAAYLIYFCIELWALLLYPQQGRKCKTGKNTVMDMGNNVFPCPLSGKFLPPAF